MKASIHQPCYLPYLGFFKKVAASDVFVFLDDAQYSKSEPFAYNSIKTPQGRMRLRIPVDYKFGNTIAEVRPKYSIDWRKKHLKSLAMNYSNAEHYKSTYAMVEQVLNDEHKTLAELNIAMTLSLFSAFGLSPKIVLSSSLDIHTKKEQRVIDICKAVGADTYVSGEGASVYQDERHFSSEGIKLVYSRFKAKPYKQMFGEFEPNLSAVDYLMNCGGTA